jgi:phage baseplate assembly protein V
MQALLNAGESFENHRYEGSNRLGVVIDRRRGPTGPQVRVHYPDRGVTSAWMPAGQRGTVGHKDYSLPELGERMLIAHLPNGPERSVAICAVFNEAVSAPMPADENTRHVEFRDGTTVDYTPGDKAMTIKAAGTLSITTEGAVTLMAPDLAITANVRIIGNVEIIGNLAVNGRIDATQEIHTDQRLHETVRGYAHD